MQRELDAPEMMVRMGEVAKEIRKSDVYPALVGVVAGGVAGALIAALIAGRAFSRRAAPAAEGNESRGGWSVRDLLQLATVVASLARQAHALMREREQD